MSSTQKRGTVHITKETAKDALIKLAPACACDHCNHGCNYGSGVLADEDIKPMAKYLGVSEKELKKEYLEEVKRFNTTKFRPKIKRKQNLPYGKCIFYDEHRNCMVHDVKPLECKIASGCKPHGEHATIWFALNHFVNPKDPDSIKEWATYLRTHPTIKGGQLGELVPDKEKLHKMLTEHHNPFEHSPAHQKQKRQTKK